MTQPSGTPTGSAATVASVRVLAPAGASGREDLDVDVIAALTRSCLSVADLSGGSLGAVATYLPGRIVPGVRVRGDTVEVHIVGRYGPTVAQLGREVQQALRGRVGGRRVDVVVEDLDLTGHQPPAPTVPAAAGPTVPLSAHAVLTVAPSEPGQL